MTIQKRAEVPAPFVVRPSGQFDGNDGKWSTFLIDLGSPKQQFRVLVSTSTFDTRVVSPAGCGYPSTPEWPDCSKDRGANTNQGFDINSSSSRNRTTSANLNLYIIDTDSTTQTFGKPPLNSTYETAANYILDTLSLTSGVDNASPVSANGSAIAAFVQPSFYLGSLGLGLGVNTISGASVPSLIEKLIISGSIPSRSFSYTAGRSYAKQPGSLVLGGYDSNRFSEATFDFPLTANLQPEVIVTSIDVQDTDGSTTSITTTGNNTKKFLALIESTLPFLYLPREVCDKFATVFSLQYDENTQLYRLSEEARTRNQNKNITIVVSDRDEKGKTRAITLPYAAFDLRTDRFISPANGSSLYFPIRRLQQDGSQSVLGRAFLQEAVLIVDYERRNFTIGNAKASDSAAFLLTTIVSPSQTSSSKKLGAGAIAGIAVGGVIALGAVFFALWFFWFRKRKSGEPKDNKIEMESRRDTLGTLGSIYSGTTIDNAGRPNHNRQASELSSDSEAARVYASPTPLHELPEEGRPLELEDKNDHTNWVRNSERMSTQGHGRFFELLGDMPPGWQRTSGSSTPMPNTPRMNASSPETTGSLGPSRSRADSGGVSPQSTTATVGLNGRRRSSGIGSPVSPRQTPLLENVSPATGAPPVSSSKDGNEAEQVGS